MGAKAAGLSFYDDAHNDFARLDIDALPAAYRAAARTLAQSDVTALAADAQRRLWVGTARDGLFALSFGASGQLLA